MRTAASASSTPAVKSETKKAYEFRVLQIPERQLMAIHDQAKGAELPHKIIGNLDKAWPYLRSNGAKTGHNVVVYRDYDRAAG